MKRIIKYFKFDPSVVTIFEDYSKILNIFLYEKKQELISYKFFNPKFSKLINIVYIILIFPLIFRMFMYIVSVLYWFYCFFLDFTVDLLLAYVEIIAVKMHILYYSTLKRDVLLLRDFLKPHIAIKESLKVFVSRKVVTNIATYKELTILNFVKFFIVYITQLMIPIPIILSFIVYIVKLIYIYILYLLKISKCLLIRRFHYYVMKIYYNCRYMIIKVRYMFKYTKKKKR